MRVVKHFAEECVGSIQLGSVGTFWIIRTSLISIIQNKIFNVHVRFFNKKCPNTPKCPNTSQLYTTSEDKRFM